MLLKPALLLSSSGILLTETRSFAIEFWYLVNWNLLFPVVFGCFATKSCFCLLMHSGISPLEHYNLHFCHFFLTSCYSKTTLLLVLWDISPLEHCNLHYCYIVFFYFDGVHFILAFCMAPQIVNIFLCINDSI